MYVPRTQRPYYWYKKHKAKQLAEKEALKRQEGEEQLPRLQEEKKRRVSEGQNECGNTQEEEGEQVDQSWEKDEMEGLNTESFQFVEQVSL